MIIDRSFRDELVKNAQDYVTTNFKRGKFHDKVERDVVVNNLVVILTDNIMHWLEKQTWKPAEMTQEDEEYELAAKATSRINDARQGFYED